MKSCIKCKISQLKSNFSKDKSRKDDLYPICKKCCNKRIKQWRLDNPEYSKMNGCKQSQRKFKLKYNYGITLEDYNRMFEFQKGACGVCGTNKSGGKKENFRVDHDHKTGKIRGLLCHKCNLMLGNSNDSIEIHLKAIEYLKKG